MSKKVSITQIVDAHARPSGSAGVHEWPDSPDHDRVSHGEPGASTDHRVIERFFPDVLAGRMEDEALIFFAMLVGPQDVLHYVPTIDAVMRLRDAKPAFVEQFRLREQKSFSEAVQTRNDIVELLKNLKKGVVEEMEKQWLKEETLPPALQRLMDALHRIHGGSAMSQ